MVNGQLVAFTTVRQGSRGDQIERIRSEVVLDTSAACARLGIPLTALFTDCSRRYLKSLESLRVILVPQQTHGLGAVRREAMRVSLETFERAKYHLWLEPEKPNLPTLAASAIPKIERAKADLCLFNRKSMDSYPPEQAHYYLFCRAAASHLLGFDVDYAFGPMIITRNSAPFFLTYQSKHGDLWDSLLVPRLRVIRSGLPYLIQVVEFRNDPRMTRSEAGHPDMILKRLRQFQNVIPSLITEWRK